MAWWQAWDGSPERSQAGVGKEHMDLRSIKIKVPEGISVESPLLLVIWSELRTDAHISQRQRGDGTVRTGA